MDFSNFGLGRVEPPDYEHIEKYPIMMSAPPSFKVEKIMQLPKYQSTWNQGQEGACFKKDVLISMADGSLKRMDQIKLFDKVLTAEGNIKEVRALFGRHYDGDIYKIKLWGHNCFECTDEHPVLTKRGYVAAKDIRLDDYVFLTEGMPFIDQELLISSFLEIKQSAPSRAKKNMVRYKGFNDVTVQVKALPKTLPMTATLGRLFGLYLAEGGTTENKVVFTFGKHEEHTLAKECISIIKESLGIEARMQIRTKSLNVCIYGKEWRQLFEYLFPGNVWSKTISREIMSGNKEFLEALLLGWISGDGHTRRNEKQGTTVSKSLALAMYRIAQSLKLCPVLKTSIPTPNESAKNRSQRWDIFIRDNAYENPRDILGKLTFRVERGKNGVWRKVREMSTEPYKGQVYNFEVEGDNSYVADGIGVHNCVGFGVTMMLTVLNMHQCALQGASEVHIKYNPWWLWDRAKEIDVFPETKPGDQHGTTVRAACEIIHKRGHCVWKDDRDKCSVDAENPAAGIAAYRWARTVDEMRLSIFNNVPIAIGVNWYSAFDKPVYYNGEWWVARDANKLGLVRGGHCVCIYGASDERQAFRFVNSWGEDYPNSFLPYEVMDKLLRQGGESSLIQDR